MNMSPRWRERSDVRRPPSVYIPVMRWREEHGLATRCEPPATPNVRRWFRRTRLATLILPALLVGLVLLLLLYTGVMILLFLHEVVLGSWPPH
jgi:hypothetical protein